MRKATEPSAVADGAAACVAAALFAIVSCFVAPGVGHSAISGPSATADGSVVVKKPAGGGLETKRRLGGLLGSALKRELGGIIFFPRLFEGHIG